MTRENKIKEINNYIHTNGEIYIKELSFAGNNGPSKYENLIINIYVMEYVIGGKYHYNQYLYKKINPVIDAIYNAIKENKFLLKSEIHDTIINFVKKQGGHIGFKMVKYRDCILEDVSIYSNDNIKYNNTHTGLLSKYNYIILDTMLTLIKENKFL